MRKDMKKHKLPIPVKLPLFIAALWLSVLLLIQFAISPKTVNGIIDKYAAEYIDGQINVGEASISAFRHFPNIGLNLEEFSITYPAERYDSLEILGAQGNLIAGGQGETADTLASFKRFTIAVNPLHLISGKISIPYARLVSLRAFIHRYHDGQSNLDIIKLPVGSESEVTEDGSAGLPDLKLGNIGLTRHPHIVYTDSKDTVFAVADLKQLKLDGSLGIDSLFIAGRIAEDTLAFGLDRMEVHEKHREMNMHADAKTLLATRSFGRMHIPMHIDARFSYRDNKVPEVNIAELNADIASIPMHCSGNIRLHEDRAGINAEFGIAQCQVSDVIDKFLKSYIPELKNVSTNSTISLNAKCYGDYIYADGTLPQFEARISVPESEFRHKDINNRLKFRLEAYTDNKQEEGRIRAGIDTMEVRCKGLDFMASGSTPDLMAEDPQVFIEGMLNAELSGLRTFLPDTLDMETAGSIKADLHGNIKLSQMDIYNFSNAQLEGKLEGRGIVLKVPADTIDVEIDKLDIELGPETKTSKRDSSKTFRLMALKGGIDKAGIVYGLMKLSGEEMSISAMNSSGGSSSGSLGILGGRFGAKNLVFTDAGGMEVELRETANGFQMMPRIGKPEVPVLTLTSKNKHIYYKDGTNRAILTDADIQAKAAMNTLERKQRMKMFMDSLAKVYPEIPRDSLFRHSLAQRQTRELPEWMKEEDFKKQDLNIKLDETIAKYFREWDMDGKLNIRTGIVMTPYFPLTNIIRGFHVKFDNDRIAIDSVKFKSGKSEIGGKGSLTGLRRALLGRGGLNLKMDVTSNKINANEILTAYSTGSRYVAPQDKQETAEISNAEYLKMVVTDTVNVQDSTTPLLVIPSNVNAEINLNAGNISYSDVLISSLDAKMTMKERCVQITDTKAESNIGNISFEGFYATRSKKNIKAGFSFNFEDITAEKVIDLVPAVDSIMPLLKSFNGQLNCEIAATASIDTNMNIIPPSINGVIRAGGKNLSIKDSEMFRSLAKKLLFKNKKEGHIQEMSVEGVISDSVMEVFPFVLKLDRYTLALSGIQNLDQSFRYHASVLRSPFLVRLGIDIYGDNFDNMKFKIGKAKYKNTNVPVFSAVIDTTKINLVNSIRGIFEKGVEAAISENAKNEAINKHKEAIGYVRAVDQELEALSEKEQMQMKEDEARLEAEENATENQEPTNKTENTK
jgi:hypothetical protein